MIHRTQPNEPRIPAGTRARCVELRLRGLGVRAIARELRLAPSTVSEHLGHPDARAVLDAAGRRAVALAQEELAQSAPAVARKLRRVALGHDKASPHEVAAMRLLLSLAGVGAPQRVELAGSLDLRAVDSDALRARLTDLRAVDMLDA